MRNIGKQLHSTCVGCIQWGGQGWSGYEYPLHPWPPHCIQPTQVECSCLPMFLIYQPEDGQWKGPKHVVVLCVISYTYLYHHIVVLDKYTHSSLVYYKHNGDDEPYEENWFTGKIFKKGESSVLTNCRYKIRLLQNFFIIVSKKEI